jgi:hypothetical protein
MRNNLMTRKEYVEQQKEAEKAFSGYHNTRGSTYIRIEDVVCDQEICSLGTGDSPYYIDEAHLAPPMTRFLKTVGSIIQSI